MYFYDTFVREEIRDHIACVVFFKLGIDARCHWNRGGQVCKLCLELLHDRGLLSCISIAKYEGKDSQSEVLVYIGNWYAFLLGGHILDQLKDLMDRGIIVDGRHLQFKLFECHDLACSYSFVTRGEASAIGISVWPWCMATKPTSANVTSQTTCATNDTISSISKRYARETC